VPDAFETLREALGQTGLYGAAEPDPAFAARLRARVERALTLPRGVTVSDLEIDEPAGNAPLHEPAHHGDIAYVSLWVPDLEKAVGFWGGVLGWELEPASGPDGRQIRDIRPHHGIYGGQGKALLFVCYLVEDLDSAVGRVLDAGGSAEAPTAQAYGRVSMCKDNQGMALGLWEPPPGQWPDRWAINGERHGDVSYVTLHVVDSRLARSFYGAVLGWEFEPGRVADGWGPRDVSPMMGMAGGHADCTASAMYRVDDLASVVARVRQAGGTATDPVDQPYGSMSECHDDQGTHFWLGQH